MEPTDAQRCRDNGWGVGTRLAGDEGYGITIIKITAIGEECILARRISDNGKPAKHPDEGKWVLWARVWQALP